MKVENISITADHHGQRIDNFLITRCKGVPKSRIYRAIRGGEVRVNKGRVSNDYRLNANDMVRVPPLRVAQKIERTPSSSLIELISQRILYEDEGVLVVNKPSGIAVHGGTETSIGLIEALRALRPQQKFLELAHRLDKGTSGCIILAKKRTALLALHELFKRPKGVQKRYLALVKGHWPKELRQMDLPLLKQHNEDGSHVVIVSRKEGKVAKTTFRPMKYLKNTTLLEAVLHTGRTHQVRVHTASAGYPIVGDEKYGDFAFNHTMQKHGSKRLFLHAASVSFQMPDKTKPILIEAPLGPELTQLIEKLEFN